MRSAIQDTSLFSAAGGENAQSSPHSFSKAFPRHVPLNTVTVLRDDRGSKLFASKTHDHPGRLLAAGHAPRNVHLIDEGRVATRSTPMIVQVEEKSEHQKLKDPAEAPGLFSHRNHLQVGSVCCGSQMDSPARMI
ncbi:hypothetical protein SRHO_G00222760 [Serrasalmus rhombeus]